MHSVYFFLGFEEPLQVLLLFFGIRSSHITEQLYQEVELETTFSQLTVGEVFLVDNSIHHFGKLNRTAVAEWQCDWNVVE
jgi:hypothetical protein